MTQHFTRNTVSVAFWCGKCQKSTQHRIDGGRKGPCLECIANLDREHDEAVKAAALKAQPGLFDQGAA
jgi:hypothetical protein